MAKHETTVVLRAKDETGRALQSAERGMHRTERQATLLSGALAHVAGLLSVAAVGGLAAGALQTADALAKQSRQLGFNVERLQELEFAASQSGIEYNTLTMALQRFGRRSAEAAEGTGEAKDALAELGIQLRNNDGTLRDVDAAFTEAINKLGQMESATKRNALAMKLFDSEGVRLVRFGENLDSLSQKARENLTIITQAQVEMAERVNDEFDKMTRRVSTSVKSIILDAVGGWEIIAEEAGVILTPVGKQLREAEDRLRRLQQLQRNRGGDVGVQPAVDAAREQVRLLRAQLNVVEEIVDVYGSGLNPELRMAERSLKRSAEEHSQSLARGIEDAAKQADAFGKALEFAAREQDKIKRAIEGIQGIQEQRGAKGRKASVLGALTASSEARQQLERGNTTRAAELALQAAEELRQVEQDTGKSVTNAEAFIKNFEQIAKAALEKSEKAQEQLKLQITVGTETKEFAFSKEGVKQAGDFTTDRVKEAARKAGRR